MAALCMPAEIAVSTECAHAFQDDATCWQVAATRKNNQQTKSTYALPEPELRNLFMQNDRCAMCICMQRAHSNSQHAAHTLFLLHGTIAALHKPPPCSNQWRVTSIKLSNNTKQTP